MAEADCSRQCRYCGNGFAYKGGQRGRKPMYCSAACRKKQSLITGPRCKLDDCDQPAVAHGYCGKHARRVKASGDPHKVKTGRRVSKACGYCGSVMALRPHQAHRTIYCSRQCMARAVAIGKGQTLRDDVLVSCHGCGITTRRKVKNDDAGRYCSRKCNTDSMARVAAEREALARMRDAWTWRPSALVAAETDALRRIARRTVRQFRTERGCTKCGTPVIGVLNWRRTCRECKADARRRQVRIAKAARKARIKGRRREAIDPIAVFERDGWRCYLCGDETPRFLRGTHEPSAPELEHKVAIANGGTHTWDNVACACRSCNQAKGARLAA